MQSPAARLEVPTGAKPWSSPAKPGDPVVAHFGRRPATQGDGTYHPFLVKFLLVSACSLLIGTMHGMLQVMPPIRAWLDSIGSPYGGPGHMIDPLAHAHMNLVGGVVMMIMGVTYYLLPILSGHVRFTPCG